MSFEDFFRRQQAPEDQPKVLLPDGKAASPRLAALLPQLASMALPCVRIKAAAAHDLSLTESKFAGQPYWPANKPYPVDAEGKYMYLLAQIDFAQVPQLNGYPEKGLLQFFISANDRYGFDYYHPADQANFRVVYHEDTSATPVADFSFLNHQQTDEGLPVSRPMRLQFIPDQDYFSFTDVRYPEGLLEELFADDSPVHGQLPLEYELGELYPESGHKIGGYAYFTQDDPRHKKAYSKYILLLQIDSQDEGICWGDVGVGNFFIHPEDLERKDFSKVLYNWDCT